MRFKVVGFKKEKTTLTSADLELIGSRPFYEVVKQISEGVSGRIMETDFSYTSLVKEPLDGEAPFWTA